MRLVTRGQLTMKTEGSLGNVSQADETLALGIDEIMTLTASLITHLLLQGS